MRLGAVMPVRMLSSMLSVGRCRPRVLAASRRRCAPARRSPPRSAASSSSAARLMAAVVTVAIPVYNGARYLDEVLAAVRAQRIDREVELLIVDSGSTDGSLEIAERHGARDPPDRRSREFSHGGTRNRDDGAGRGRARRVPHPGRDARPRRLAGGAAGGLRAGATTSRSCSARTTRGPDASHMIKCEMERHFATWGDGARDRRPAARALARPSSPPTARFPGRLTFFSDVNGCVAKWAWRADPLPRRSPTPRTSCSGAR